MNRKAISILFCAIAIITLGSFLLKRLQKTQKLGQPGVKLVKEPTTNNAGAILSPVSVYLPKDIPYFQSQGLPVTDREYEVLPRDTTYGRRDYRSADGFQCRTSVVLMGSDRTSIHKPQYCLVGQGWKLEKSEVETIRMPQPHPYDLKLMKLTVSITALQGDKVVPITGIYAYWFVADGELTHDHWQRMAMIARDMLTSSVLQRWSYISYFSYGSPGQEDALFERMKKLMITTVPLFQIASGLPVKTSAETRMNESNQPSHPLANLSSGQ